MSSGDDKIQKFEELFLGKKGSLEDFLEARSMIESSRRVQEKFVETLSALESGESVGINKKEAPRRLAVGLWMAGRLDEAARRLSRFNDVASHFFAGQCLTSLNRSEEARTALKKIPARSRTPMVEAAIARTFRLEGKLDEAADYARGVLKKNPDGADLHCEVGLAEYHGGEYDAAVESFDKALKADSEHRSTMFHLAYVLYQRGGDEEAVELYEKLVAMKPVHVGALANLAFIYEDMGMYEKSSSYLQKLHDADPANTRLTLLYELASSCEDMYYDDEKQKQVARRERLLQMSIDDFELSIRSRKCLEEMAIETLGDLVSRTESELLSFNNFGETSLAEVKSILKQKGLDLEAEAPAGESTPVPDATVRNDALDLSLEKSGLSVRVRKSLEDSSLKTLEDVCAKTGKELLDIKDFGRASLRELKKKISGYDLSLKEE